MKEIQLTNGGITIIDDEDYARVKCFTWSHNPCGYAQAWVNGRPQSLHRLLMNPPADMEIDHINRNKLDNQKANLRICTRKENMQNTNMHGWGLALHARGKIKKDASSQYLGVDWQEYRHRWRARIVVNNNPLYLRGGINPKFSGRRRT
jgi:hypothetical protein